jgi:hypothetical protein
MTELMSDEELSIWYESHRAESLRRRFPYNQYITLSEMLMPLYTFVVVWFDDDGTRYMTIENHEQVEIDILKCVLAWKFYRFMVMPVQFSHHMPAMRAHCKDALKVIKLREGYSE